MSLFKLHKHEWLSVASRVHEYTRPRGGDVTVVLQRCASCGKFRELSIAGVWTPAEVGAPPSMALEDER